MARAWFGGTSNDYLFDPINAFGSTIMALNTSPLVGTCWSAETGGIQYTDLLDANDVSITSVSVSGSQLPAFQGPDGIMQLWIDLGSGRVLLVAWDQATAAAASASAAAASAAAAAASAAGPVKRAAVSLSVGGTAQAAVSLDRLNRVLVELPVATARWRLRAANHAVLTNTVLTTPLTFSDVYVGAPTYGVTVSDPRWTGSFAAAPTKALSGFTTPTDGTDYVSPWVSDPTLQFAPSVPIVVSYGISTPATGSGLSVSAGAQGCYVATGGSALAGTQTITPTGIANGVLIGDVRIEYECTGVQVGLCIGDSITEGAGQGDVLALHPGALPHETWPGAAAMQGGWVAINGGCSASALSGPTWASLTAAAFTRFDLATTVPDFAIIALGTNDSTGALGTTETALRALISNVRSLGIHRIYLTTLLPRTNLASLQGYLTSSATAGATTIISSINPGTVPIVIDTGGAAETVTVSAVSGTGPYTLTVSALTKTHVGAPSLADGAAQIISGGEIFRQQFNDFVRSLPDGVAGCLDFEALVSRAPGSAVPDLRYISAQDGLHPMRAGYQRMAQLAATVGQLVTH